MCERCLLLVLGASGEQEVEDARQAEGGQRDRGSADEREDRTEVGQRLSDEEDTGEHADSHYDSLHAELCERDERHSELELTEQTRLEMLLTIGRRNGVLYALEYWI